MVQEQCKLPSLHFRIHHECLKTLNTGSIDSSWGNELHVMPRRYQFPPRVVELLSSLPFPTSTTLP
jgi:hypothetical protein